MALVLDQEHGSFAYPEAVENAEVMERATPDASVVNVHANFLIPTGERHSEGSFAHLEQMSDLLKAAELRQGLVPLSSIDPARLGARPFRTPDYGKEWGHLRKAWKLHRNGKAKLSQRELETLSAIFHPDEPVKDLADAIWRFLTSITQPCYEAAFAAAIKQIDALPKDQRLRAFLRYYEAEMLPGRASRYVDIMTEFFSAYSEFGQVYFSVIAGVPVPDDHLAGSANFAAVRMFYGNAFEALSSSIDFLACTNNLLSGRDHTAFQTMTLSDYLKTDKAGRHNCFAMNASFSAICEEWDNQLRNASHHGGLRFDEETQIITYRSGKGGTGPEQQLSYVEYLVRSTKLFLQLMTVFRIEIMLAHVSKGAAPI